MIEKMGADAALSKPGAVGALGVGMPAVSAPFLSSLDYRGLAAAVLCARALRVFILDTVSSRALYALLAVDPAQGLWNHAYANCSHVRADLWWAHFERIPLDVPSEARS